MPKYEDENGEGVYHNDGENAGTSQDTSISGRRDMTTAGSSSASGNLNDHQNGKGNRRNKTKNESQLNLTLGAYTVATSDAVRLMSETERAIRHLSDMYKKHSSDIEKFDTMQNRLGELQQECATKVEEIRRQRIIIDGLTEYREEKDKELEKGRKEKEEEIENMRQEIVGQKTALEEEKKAFKTAKDNANKRAKLELAEQKLKQDKELAKQMEDLEQQKKKEEDKKRNAISDLEASNTRLSEELEKNKAALTKAHTEFSDMRRLRDSFESETKTLKVMLKTMENEFGLQSQGLDFYKKSFNDISQGIKVISMSYFSELSRQDFDAVHDELQDADIYFSSVPISDSDESRLLRVAHAQRVISAVLCEIVWQPFPSEHLHDPQLIENLGTISAQVAESTYSNGPGRRAGTVWRALTTRALQSLDPNSLSASHTTPQKSPMPSRLEKVVSEVFRVLAPLVDPVQATQFRNDVANLARSAISAWNCAQRGEHEMSICATLCLADHAAWRSEFDDGSDAEAVSSTRPRIFTLFPRVITKEFLSVEPPGGPPGSWPESKQGPRELETCIHSGIGLQECSSLVIKGKQEEDERQAVLEREKKRVEEYREMLRKERMPPNKNGPSSRTGSVAGSVPGPAGPIAQWGGEGKWRTFEEVG